MLLLSNEANLNAVFSNQGHGYDPQDGKPPVALELVKDDIQPGGDVSLKLVAEEGVTFKGFIVQVTSLQPLPFFTQKCCNSY